MSQRVIQGSRGLEKLYLVVHASSGEAEPLGLRTGFHGQLGFLCFLSKAIFIEIYFMT